MRQPARKSYEVVRPGEPAYDLIQESQAAGRWVCDSRDHNEDAGCSNPDCFKYRGDLHGIHQ